VEGLLHPLVFKKIDSFLEDLQRRGGGERMVVIEIPLLFESGYAGKIGQTVTVVAGEEIALRRLEKAGVSRESGMARMKTQMPISEKVAKSDFTIENSGTPEETRAQVVALYKRLLEEVRAS
jgi:dephospho-CoA kinase